MVESVIKVVWNLIDVGQNQCKKRLEFFQKTMNFSFEYLLIFFYRKKYIFVAN